MLKSIQQQADEMVDKFADAIDLPYNANVSHAALLSAIIHVEGIVEELEDLKSLMDKHLSGVTIQFDKYKEILTELKSRL